MAGSDVVILLRDRRPFMGFPSEWVPLIRGVRDGSMKHADAMIVAGVIEFARWANRGCPL